MINIILAILTFIVGSVGYQPESTLDCNVPSDLQVNAALEFYPYGILVDSTHYQDRPVFLFYSCFPYTEVYRISLEGINVNG